MQRSLGWMSLTEEKQESCHVCFYVCLLVSFRLPRTSIGLSYLHSASIS